MPGSGYVVCVCDLSGGEDHSLERLVDFGRPRGQLSSFQHILRGFKIDNFSACSVLDAWK